MMTDAEVCEWFAREVMGWNYGTALEAWAREWWIDPRFLWPATLALVDRDWDLGPADPGGYEMWNSHHTLQNEDAAAAVLAAIRIEYEERVDG